MFVDLNTYSLLGMEIWTPANAEYPDEHTFVLANKRFVAAVVDLKVPQTAVLVKSKINIQIQGKTLPRRILFGREITQGGGRSFQPLKQMTQEDYLYLMQNCWCFEYDQSWFTYCVSSPCCEYRSTPLEFLEVLRLRGVLLLLQPREKIYLEGVFELLEGLSQVLRVRIVVKGAAKVLLAQQENQDSGKSLMDVVDSVLRKIESIVPACLPVFEDEQFITAVAERSAAKLQVFVNRLFGGMQFQSAVLLRAQTCGSFPIPIGPEGCASLAASLAQKGLPIKCLMSREEFLHTARLEPSLRSAAFESTASFFRLRECSEVENLSDISRIYGEPEDAGPLPAGLQLASELQEKRIGAQTDSQLGFACSEEESVSKFYESQGVASFSTKSYLKAICKSKRLPAVTTSPERRPPKLLGILGSSRIVCCLLLQEELRSPIIAQFEAPSLVSSLEFPTSRPFLAETPQTAFHAAPRLAPFQPVHAQLVPCNSPSTHRRCCPIQDASDGAKITPYSQTETATQTHGIAKGFEELSALLAGLQTEWPSSVTRRAEVTTSGQEVSVAPQQPCQGLEITKRAPDGEILDIIAALSGAMETLELSRGPVEQRACFPEAVISDPFFAY